MTGVYAADPNRVAGCADCLELAAEDLERLLRLADRATRNPSSPTHAGMDRDKYPRLGI